MEVQESELAELISHFERVGPAVEAGVKGGKRRSRRKGKGRRDTHSGEKEGKRMREEGREEEANAYQVGLSHRTQRTSNS